MTKEELNDKFWNWLERTFGESPDVSPWASHYVPSGIHFIDDMNACFDDLKWGNLNEYITGQMCLAYCEGFTEGKLSVENKVDNKSRDKELEDLKKRLDKIDQYINKHIAKSNNCIVSNQER